MSRHTGPSPTEKVCRRIILERSNGLCERCGRQGNSLHHRRKRSAGGPWTASNCVWLCGSGVTGCHGWVESHPKAAMESGWWVSRYGDERMVPVLRLGVWVFLQDDGTVVAAGKPSTTPNNHN